MSTSNLNLFYALNAKVDYLDRRQKLISQNVANADTPGYRPYDLTKVDFGRILKKVTGETTLRMDAPTAGHMPPASENINPKTGKARITYEVAPAGNAVDLEEQMVNANRVSIDYGLMLNVYRKNVSMLKTAIGAGASA